MTSNFFLGLDVFMEVCACLWESMDKYQYVSFYE